VRRSALWNVEELQAAGAEVFVVGRDSRILFRSTDAAIDLQPALALWQRQSAGGTFEWRIGGAPHVASYWHLFLKPQYGTDWFIVQSRDRAREFAPLLGFQQRFMLIAVLATLVVLAASLNQIRRTLDPIERLQAATRQIALGNFSARANIERRDEFADLGRSFDAMTGELVENIRRREQTEQALVLARDKAIDAARVRTDFLTNVSHELRTPLTAIVSGIEILRRYGDEDAAVRDEFIAMIGGEATRLAALVDDILQLAAPALWELAPTDVAAALRSAVAAMSAENRARVVLTVAADLPKIAGDRERLVQLFEHLLDNAAKFSPPSSPIEVRAMAHDGQCVVEVTDRGSGIAPKDVPFLFEPFRQFGNDILTEKPAGTGLGLALARNIVDRHRGRIGVTSAPGQGSTFRVELPALADIELATAR
jgi:signal transduction histidine kinase